MARSIDSRQLLYAHTSAHTSDDTNVAGLGVVIKAPRRHTIHKTSDTKATSDRVVAAYEAISIALREAKRMGARAVVIRTDCEPVIWQLDKRVPVSRDQLARHLETRSLLNQFHRADVAFVRVDDNRIAHELAVRAWEHACRLQGEPDGQLALPLVGTGTA